MSAGVTFGNFALEAFTKLKKSRAAEVDNRGGKHEAICTESDTGAAAASSAAAAPQQRQHIAEAVWISEASSYNQIVLQADENSRNIAEHKKKDQQPHVVTTGNNKPFDQGRRRSCPRLNSDLQCKNICVRVLPRVNLNTTKQMGPCPDYHF